MKSGRLKKSFSTLEMLPTEIQYMIADKLDLKSAKHLSFTSCTFFKVHLSKTYFTSKVDIPEDVIKHIIKTATNGIKDYLKNIKPHPGYTWFDKDVKYDKGYHRACCFFDILSNDFLSLKFRLFILYTLLKEENGNVLKEKIRSSLHKISNDTVTSISAYVSHHYQDQLAIMQESLLSQIHNCYATYARNKYYLGDPPHKLGREGDWRISEASEELRVKSVNLYWGRLEKIMNHLQINMKPRHHGLGSIPNL